MPSDPRQDAETDAMLAAYFEARRGAIINVVAHKASPPEYPGLALVPVADIERLEQFIDLPRTTGGLLPRHRPAHRGGDVNELEALRELSEAATPGPWNAYISYSGESGLPDEVGLYAGAATTHGMENTIISDFVSRSENIMPDLDFIVAAVNYVRAALTPESSNAKRPTLDVLRELDSRIDQDFGAYGEMTMRYAPSEAGPIYEYAHRLVKDALAATETPDTTGLRERSIGSLTTERD